MLAPGRARVLADKASKANRAYLRQRRIKRTIPVKDDQAAHRRKLGAKGGRPPAFDPEIYRQRPAGDACSMCIMGAPRRRGRRPRR